MREGNAAVSTDEIATKVRFSPCKLPQALQPGTPSLQSTGLQNTTLGRPRRVAKPRGLGLRRLQHECVNRRRVRTRLTAPSGEVNPSLKASDFVGKSIAGGFLHNGVTIGTTGTTGTQAAEYVSEMVEFLKSRLN